MLNLLEDLPITYWLLCTLGITLHNEVVSFICTKVLDLT